MIVEFRKPTHGALTHIADNMRKADRAEVWEMSQHTPCQSLRNGVKVSDHASVITINGVPCAVVGLVVVSLLTGTGVPWLLGTNDAVKYRRVFLEKCHQGIADMLTVCPHLYNYVHADNKISVRWLEHMGFQLQAPRPMGINGALFHKFTMGVQYV